MLKKFNAFENRILVQIMELAEEHDGIASMRDYVDSGRKPNLETILAVFGTWNRAVSVTNYVPLAKADVTLTQEDVIRKIYEIRDENNGVISFELYKNKFKKDGLQKINNVFGTWNNALLHAGIEPDTCLRNRQNDDGLNEAGIYRSVNDVVTNEDVTKFKEYAIKQLIAQNKEMKGKIDKNSYRRSGRRPSVNSIIRIFGSWSAALMEAGISNETKNHNSYTDSVTSEELIITQIKEFFNETNSLSERLYKQSGRKPSATTIRRICGTWNDALILAGFSKKLIKEKVEEEMKRIAIKRVQGFYKKTNSTSERIYKESGITPSATSIRRLFGTWQNFLKEANLPSKPNAHITKL